MTQALLLIGGWVVLAFALSAVPSQDNHWRRAYVLIAIGVPLALWIFWHHGALMGLLALAVGARVLRWPVYYGWLRVKGWLNLK